MSARRIVSVCRSLPNPDDPSGGVFVLRRLRAMAELADVTVVQPVPYAPGLRPLPRWATAPRQVDGLTIVPAPMFYLPAVLKSADGMWLARAIRTTVKNIHRATPIDLIDAHFGYPEGVGCASVAKQLGVPLFVTVRGFENEYVERPLVGARMLNALRGAKGCIAVSNSLQSLLIEHGVSAQRIRVIHNAIDSQTFSCGERAAARTALGLGGDGPLVVSVGHLVSRKRHHVLIEAFAKVREHFPAASLAIIGARSFEAAYPDRLADLVRRHGLQDHVRFVGNIPPRDVAVWLQAADVFALGTAREGCCNAVLEALATGVPVVTTPAGDNEFFVQNDNNGCIVPIDDAAAFAAGIERALRRSWDRSAIGRRLFEQAGSWSGVAERVLAFMTERLGVDATAAASS
jgi:teichuronic acid biosynthesis glycosyltransferase TuaC